jgi:hypothetical protein
LRLLTVLCLSPSQTELLEAAGEDIEAKVELQSYDEIHFVWMVSFFTGFQRLRNSHREGQSTDSTATASSLSTSDELEGELDDISTVLGKKQSVADPAAYDVDNIDDKEQDDDDKEAEAAPTISLTRGKKIDPTKAQRLVLLGPVAAGIEFEVFHFIASKLGEYVHDKQWEHTEVALRAVREIVRRLGPQGDLL